MNIKEELSSKRLILRPLRKMILQLSQLIANTDNVVLWTGEPGENTRELSVGKPGYGCCDAKIHRRGVGSCGIYPKQKETAEVGWICTGIIGRLAVSWPVPG